MSFLDSGNSPSTQPFQPFLAATRFFLGGLTIGGAVDEGCGDQVLRAPPRGVSSSSSSGVYGLLDEVAEVAEDIEGPGVEDGEDIMGGGVTETDRELVAMWIAGRVCQKVETAGRGIGATMVGFLWTGAGGADALWLVEATMGALSRDFEDDFLWFSLSSSFIFSLSFSLFFSFFTRLASSSFSTDLLIGTPLSRLVRTSRGGCGSKSPANTLVAVRLRLLG